MIWVLVDVSYLAYRAMHAVGDLENEDVPTGVIFGFFHQLRQICLDRRIQSNRVAIFCDSRTSLRKRAHPPYKEKRWTERTQEEIEKVRTMRTQVELLSSEVLPEIGFPVHQQEGLESDDTIAWVANRISTDARLRLETDRKAVMVTSDGDLFQSITEHVHWFDPQRDRYLTPTAFAEWKGVPPSTWGEVKALSGCSSDCVAGVPGVGEATAIRFLKGELPPRLKAHQSIVSRRDVVDRNRRLVVLPHEATEPVVLREPRYDAGEFFRQCKRFGLLSVLRDKESWAKFFDGRFHRVRRRGEKKEQKT